MKITVITTTTKKGVTKRNRRKPTVYKTQEDLDAGIQKLRAKKTPIFEVETIDSIKTYRYDHKNYKITQATKELITPTDTGAAA